MIHSFINFLRKLTPKWAFPIYHNVLAYLAAFNYNWPSRKLIVIGVTGTNGKSTVVQMIGKFLESMDQKVGWTTTVSFKVGGEETMNNLKMTLPGRFALQRQLHKMVKAGCTHAIIEISSEGLKQGRARGVIFDGAVFTNLTPEHLEAHGTFEKYRQAKQKLFLAVQSRGDKKINGVHIPTFTVVNADDENVSHFIRYSAEKKLAVHELSCEKHLEEAQDLEILNLSDIQLYANGANFSLDKYEFKSNLLGQFNVFNCAQALAVMKALGYKFSDLKLHEAVAKFILPGGRLEKIEAGQDFIVVVDYAPEPASLAKGYEVLKILPHQKIIHVLGSCGGGRDVARRPVLGQLVGRNADYVIVTDEDPYDDEPALIREQVLAGAVEVGKVLGQNLFNIADRREAIKYALSLAQKNDLVYITGKGSEQAMVVAGRKKIPWDDRKVVKDILSYTGYEF